MDDQTSDGKTLVKVFDEASRIYWYMTIEWCYISKAILPSNAIIHKVFQKVTPRLHLWKKKTTEETERKDRRKKCSKCDGFTFRSFPFNVPLSSPTCQSQPPALSTTLKKLYSLLYSLQPCDFLKLFGSRSFSEVKTASCKEAVSRKRGWLASLLPAAFANITFCKQRESQSHGR